MSVPTKHQFETYWPETHSKIEERIMRHTGRALFIPLTQTLRKQIEETGEPMIVEFRDEGAKILGMTLRLPSAEELEEALANARAREETQAQ